MKNFVWSCILMPSFSCNTPAVNTNIKAIEKEVMDIHDDVMPRMGEVVFLTDTIDSMIKVEKDSTKLNELSLIHEALLKSDKDMMHWMRSYESPVQPYDSSTVSYINKEKEKVIKLRAFILKSISDGKTALQNH